jgi:3-hydroxyisobutyrate dehydrogenase-like beta-hydroxyacid dehydrogenase
MSCQVALLGFGEAAQAFAEGAGWDAAAFDRDRDGPRAEQLRDAARRLGVQLCAAPAQALAGRALVLSLVTPDQAEAAAQAAAAHLAEGALYLDMNSATPAAKQRAAARLARCGARYADIAIMAPVLPGRRSVPLLVAGPDAEAAHAALSALGFPAVEVAGATIGDAAAIKLLRSVVIKGAEALLAESLVAAQRAGLVEPLLRALGPGWAAQAGHALQRMLAHGQRRSAEMAGAVAMLEGLGLPAPMSRATAGWQAALGLPPGTPLPDGLAGLLGRAAARLAPAAAATERRA